VDCSAAIAILSDRESDDRQGHHRDVTNVYAQWHRNLIRFQVPPGDEEERSARRRSQLAPAAQILRRPYRELASHQIDVAISFRSSPEFVCGRGIDYSKTPRRFRQHPDDLPLSERQRLMYSSICSNQHLPLFAVRARSRRKLLWEPRHHPHYSGNDNEAALGLWFMEPPKKERRLRQQGRCRDGECSSYDCAVRKGCRFC